MTATKIYSTVAAGLLVVGTMLSAPAVNAKPSNGTLKTECQNAGGTWESTPDGNGGTESSCEYHDIGGHKYRDFYKNGKYLGTDSLDR